MKARWKLWVAGIALVQTLVVGVDVVLLWPIPSQAEQFLARLHDGMSMGAVNEAVKGPAYLSYGPGNDSSGPDGFCDITFSDGSVFSAKLRLGEEFRTADPLAHLGVNPDEKLLLVLPATDLLPAGSRTVPNLGAAANPVPITPLTRLRRTLARIIPALGD